MPVPDAVLRAVDENVVGRRNGDVGAEERRLAPSDWPPPLCDESRRWPPFPQSGTTARNESAPFAPSPSSSPIFAAAKARTSGTKGGFTSKEPASMRDHSSKNEPRLPKLLSSPGNAEK